jgi:hypothetical protein
MDQSIPNIDIAAEEPMREIFGFDAFAPEIIAERVETVGVAKAGLPLLSMIVLGVFGGYYGD